MTKFKASNDMGSPRTVFYYRALYDQEALSSVTGGPRPEIRDFSFAENVLYGRVDTRLNTVYPDESTLKVISSETERENSYRLLNFAADAFEAIRAKMYQARDIGVIPDDDQIFSTFKIKKAYESPVSLYNKYIDDLMEDYIMNYLAIAGHKQKVFNLEHFINEFIIFLNNKAQHTPFTFTSWQRSTTSNIFTSGIAVTLANMRFGEDPTIEQRILKSKAFRYYLNVCRQNGFLVSEKSPFMLVADIMSPGLLQYSKNSSIFTIEEVFLSCYNYAYMVDYDILFTKMFDGYNLFAARFPQERIVSKKCHRSYSTFFRTPLTQQQIKSKYSTPFWLAKYSTIRNIEENGVLSGNIFKKMQKKIKLSNHLDKEASMRYINSTFRETYKSKYGGTNYFVKRKATRNNGQESSIVSTTGATKIENEITSPNDFTTNILPSSGGSSGGY